jgi:hypothetical protein
MTVDHSTSMWYSNLNEFFVHNTNTHFIGEKIVWPGYLSEYYTQELIKVRVSHAGRVVHRHVLLTTSLTPLTELVLRYTPQILTFPNSYQRTGIFSSFRFIFLGFPLPRSLVVTILLKVTINTNKLNLKVQKYMTVDHSTSMWYSNLYEFLCIILWQITWSNMFLSNKMSIGIMDIWLELINCDYIYLFKFIFMCMIEKKHILLILILFFSLILIGLVIALFILNANKILYDRWCSSSFITKSYFPFLYEIRDQ